MLVGFSHTVMDPVSLFYCRSQTSAEDGTAGAEEKQEERLLQSARGWQERHRGRDQKSLSQTGPHAPPGYPTLSFCTHRYTNFHII